MALTRDEIELFHNNGFLKLPATLPGDIVAQLRQTVLDHIRDAIEPVVRNASGRVVRISQLWHRGGIFQRVMAGDEALDCLESVLSPNIMLTLNRHNHATLRTADAGGEFQWHRDVSHWTRTIVTVLFYLEDAPLERGCTHVVPGSHKLRYVPRGAQGVGAFEQEGIMRQAVPVPCAAGDMLMINSLILHCVGRNTTSESRMSMTVGYHDADELYPMGNDKCVLVRGKAAYEGNDQYL
jgi:ectoine hydroxylase-related dioxygenase (phytanoyl-CoA dioxygenase family)